MLDACEKRSIPIINIEEIEYKFESFYTLFLKIHDYENRACHSSDISQTLSLDLHFTD